MVQLQILNRVLSEHDSSIITLNNLTADYFTDYPQEFRFIQNHLKAYNTLPDMATFVNQFPNFEVITVQEPNTYLLSELTKEKTARAIAEAVNNARPKLLNGDIETAVAILKEATENSIVTAGLNCVDLMHDQSRYEAYRERCENHDKAFITTGLPELDRLLGGGWDVKEEVATIVARSGVGKCLEKGTKILMADGSTKAVEDVQIGDKVQSLNRINTILALHNGRSKGYKIIPKLGDPFTVSANHILTLMKRNEILNKGGILHTTDNTFTLVDISIEDYLALSPNQRKLYHLYRPAVDYPTKDLKIPPYILGLWLGDGTSCRVSLTNTDPEIINEWTNWGYQYTDVIRADRYTYDVTNPQKKGQKVETLELFRYYDLLNNKHIPLEYLTGDRNQRLELLAGIIDTDGYCSKKYRAKSNTNICMYSICLKSKLLVEQIAQLARGLNFRVGKIGERRINNKVKGLTSYWTICISGKDIDQIPCRLSRKQAIRSSTQRDMNMCAFSVIEVPEIEYYGFMADGDHRYMLADNILTHNTWILLKAAADAAVAGKRVGIYSGEMSANKVGFRIDTLIGHLANGAIVHGEAYIKNQYRTYLDNLDKSTGNLFILTPDQIGGPATVSTLRAFIEKYNLEILFIDQHSLLEDERKGKTPVEKAANISKDIKLLQTVKQIPIISASQQNREKLEDSAQGQKQFDLTQIAQSDRIAQDSSVVIFIERIKDQDLFKLHLLKSRDNGDGKILTYNVKLNEGLFQYIPDETSTQEAVEEAGYSADEVF